MTTDNELPFQSFVFTLIQNKHPRTMLRITAAEDGFFELEVQKGSATSLSSHFTRKIPIQVVERFRDVLQSIGVFNWNEVYGDSTCPGACRWTISTVFKEGVFSVESKGGSDVPHGFDEMLEELYRLDFPRTAEQDTRSSSILSSSVTPTIPSSIGDFAAFASKEGFPDLGDLTQFNPAGLQQRMKEEFRHMSTEEQNQLIDMLVQMGAGTRDYWERFFRN